MRSTLSGPASSAAAKAGCVGQNALSVGFTIAAPVGGRLMIEDGGSHVVHWRGPFTLVRGRWALGAPVPLRSGGRASAVSYGCAGRASARTAARRPRATGSLALPGVAIIG